jgi:thiamine-monophosphate kinase
MTEFELIARLIPTLATNSSVLVAAGDDCAVLDLGIPSHSILFKTDAVVEGIHFTKETDPQRVGHKALARCLSDVAAMSGQPTHALVTLGLPKDFDAGFVESVYRGLNTLAARYEMAIVGGETTLNPERVFISVSVLGKIEKGKQVTRSGAQLGDAIFVTGQLGGSLEGKHLDFEPRVAEAQWLAGHFDLHAMMDISDGLAGDLRHLLNASHVGAELLTKAIPISRAARLRGRAFANAEAFGGLPPAPSGVGKPPLLAALTDGEDFELLFTVASREAVPLLDAWKQRFPDLGLSCIGKIIPGAELFLKDKEGVRPFTAHGYVHFA